MTGCQNTVKNEMKKLILIICAVLATGLTATSCKKTTSCRCKHYYQGDLYQTTEWHNVNGTCSQLANDIEYSGNTTVNCSQI